MGGNAVKISRPVTFEEAQAVVDYLKISLFPQLSLYESNYCILGSYGKKLDGQTYGDIDIAVYLNDSIREDQDIKFLVDALEYVGLQTKINYGFKIVSFACPIYLGRYDEKWYKDPSGFVQVDLMITPSLEWSKFIYHSPNFRKNESQYKGLYRNILLMALITEPEKWITKETPEGGIEEIEVNILRYPKGIYRVRKNFMGKKGLVKNGKNVEGSDTLITYEPGETIRMTVGSQYRISDIDTFEKLWNIVLSEDFKWKNKREDIVNRFIECLGEQKLSLPKELIEWKA